MEVTGHPASNQESPGFNCPFPTSPRSPWNKDTMGPKFIFSSPCQLPGAVGELMTVAPMAGRQGTAPSWQPMVPGNPMSPGLGGQSH